MVPPCSGELFSKRSSNSTRRIGQILTKVGSEVQMLDANFKRATQAFEAHQENSVLVIEGVRRSQDDVCKRLEAKIDELGSQAAEHGLNMFISGQLHSLLPPTAAAVHLSKHQQTMCVPSCACLCHSWRELRSPHVFDGLMGSLLLGYTGVPLVTKNCTIKACKVKATYALKFSYQFPLWLLSYAVTVATYSRYGKPTAGLSVTRIRPHNSQVFAMAESGNATGLKHIFDRGLASPCDVSAQTGDQPLHVRCLFVLYAVFLTRLQIAADHGFVEVCRLLLCYGADPYQWDTQQKKYGPGNDF